MVAEQRWPLRLLSAVLLGLQVAFAALHATVGISIRGTAVPVANTSHLIGLNWWWLCAFGVTAIALGVTWWRGRYRHQAHAVSGAVWAMYAAELWFATFRTPPYVPITWPVAATGLAIMYAVVAGALAEAADLAARGER